MEFRILPRGASPPPTGENTGYLNIDLWNDFSFVTMFDLSLHDEHGNYHNIGEVKIGFRGQTAETATHERLPNNFTHLSDDFFSLGQGVKFYKQIASLPNQLGKTVLAALRDIVLNPKIIQAIQGEDVLSVSLLRDTSLSVIKGQFARVLDGMAELTSFCFRFVRPESPQLGSIELTFDVEVNSKPSTSIHAVIGRNGAGKTTLLNGMIDAITRRPASAKFFDTKGWESEEIQDDYFSSLVSVSFSAFDPFHPPQEQSDPAKGTCYFYIGLKDPSKKKQHLSITKLQDDYAKALITCFHKPEKTARWKKAIEKLGSDENFAAMELENLEGTYSAVRGSLPCTVQSDSPEFREVYLHEIQGHLSEMSSGHAAVLLTITRLVAAVEEKTLVIIDEPESHLHPPLLSAFLRALSDLLHDQNGVAIIATHSPVVLQEIPRSCAWKIYRSGKTSATDRPKIETFGENVGLLTSEVFSLEVERSGFHELLARSVDRGLTYEEIIAEYSNQLGFEARAILSALVASRDRSRNHDTTS